MPVGKGQAAAGLSAVLAAGAAAAGAAGVAGFLAAATGAAFVREIFTGTYASDMGVWAPDAGAAQRYQHRLGNTGCALLYNVSAEFAGSLDPRSLPDRARSAVFSSIPDAVLVSGAVPWLADVMLWGGVAFLLVYGALRFRAAWQGGAALMPAPGGEVPAQGRGSRT